MKKKRIKNRPKQHFTLKTKILNSFIRKFVSIFSVILNRRLAVKNLLRRFKTPKFPNSQTHKFLKSIPKFVNSQIRKFVSVFSVILNKVKNLFHKFKTPKFPNSYILKFLKNRSRPQYSKNYTQFFGIILLTAGFVFGIYFSISGVIRFVHALTETTTSMPTDVAFNADGYADGSGEVSVLSSEVRMATSSSWWNGGYLYKKAVTLKNNNTSTDLNVATGSAQITVNTKELYDEGKLQADCDDLRIAYIATESANIRQELPRSYTIASGATDCSDSTATIITFPRQDTLWASGGTSSNYELYYGNENAETADHLNDNGYNITRSDGSTASATLACSFNGSTTCSGGETPTTETGAIRYSGGKSALSFDGKDDYVNLPTLPTITTPYSVSLWLNPKSIPRGTLLSLTHTSYPRFIFTDQKLLLYSGPDKYIYGSKTFSTSDLNQWWHIVFVVASPDSLTDWRIYVNGENGTGYVTTNTGNYYEPGASGYIGGPSSYFNGLIDELVVYDHELSAEEVSVLYNEGNPTPTLPSSDIQLLFHFDENGDDPRSAGLTLDASGNGNHGTITGAKYVGGLVGVDSSSVDTGYLGTQSYAGHSGIFIEEGTTNLITNPSFENASSATLNWGLNYFNYATASATFTPNVGKRNSAGPFAQGVMVQGKLDGSGGADHLYASTGNQVASNFFANTDMNQGSVSFFWTPESSSGTRTGNAYLLAFADTTNFYYSYDSNYFRFKMNNSSVTSATITVEAGITYHVVVRWDWDSKIDGTNYGSISINNSHTFSLTSVPAIEDPTILYIGNYWNDNYSANGIIEGFTIYRRVLYSNPDDIEGNADDTGINVGNGDEIEQIYFAGAGKDPTLVTGSWDVVFALPTDATGGSLGSGTVTGQAWSHPHGSNVLYSSTDETGGFFMNGHYGNANNIEINRSGSTVINAGSDAGLDNLTNGQMTVEAWIRPDSNGPYNVNYITTKGNNYLTAAGWSFDYRYSTRTMMARIKCSTQEAVATTTTVLPNWGEWTHVAYTFNGTTKAAPRIFINGVEATYANQQACVGDITDDSSYNLHIGHQVASYGMDGGAGWTRVSNSIRYTNTFMPSNLPPEVDASTVAQWNMSEGSGTTIDNAEGTAARDATVTNGSWITTNWQNQSTPTTASKQLTSEKIFAGGIKVTSDAAGEGVKRVLSNLTAGQNYVVRAIANSDEVTSIPKVQIWDATNNHEITQLTGTATSTRTDPDVLLFTFELPTVARYNPNDPDDSYDWVDTDTTSIEVRLINTENSGTVYWHQVELLENKVDNPSMEGLATDPYLPSGWSQLGSWISSGDLEREDVPSDIYSGNYALQGNDGWATSEGVYQNISFSSGKFVSSGLWGKGGGATWGYGDFTAQDGINNNRLTVSGSTYVLQKKVFKSSGANATKPFYGASGVFNADDIYVFQLSDVSLTVTPASQTNSTETTGLRVDGADILSQPVSGLSLDKGVIKFKVTPRHSWSTVESFGSTGVYVARIGTSSSNQILLYETSDNLRLRGIFNGTAVDALWNNPVLNANTTYNFEIGYKANGTLYLKVDGVEVASQTGVVSFSSLRSIIYFGSNSYGDWYDATYTSYVASTPTENTTAPYYKFGSKSVKLIGYDKPDEYTTSVTLASNAKYTLSAYVYDGTTANVGGVVGESVAKLASDSASLTTSYTDMGGGWWRLSHTTDTIPANTHYFGVQVQPGKTIYIDGVQAEQKEYATTYADGSLGTGYSWSGSEHESTSDRTVSHMYYSPTNNVSPSAGTISLWFKPNFSINNNTTHIFVDSPGDANYRRIQMYKSSDNKLYFRVCGDIANGCSTASVANPEIVTNTWQNVVLVWNSDGIVNAYLNNTSYSPVISGTWLTPTAFNTTRLYIGEGRNNLNQSNSIISDLRIYDSALTAGEVADIYYQGLSTYSSGNESDDRYSDGAHTYTSPVIDLSANGQWGSTPWSTMEQLNNGTISYYSRTSPDNTDWSNWQQVTGGVIASDPRRYFQWKAELTANEGLNESPVIRGLSLSYVEDTTAPINPQATALGYINSASSSATLTSSEWYNYSSPKFTWDEAVDDAALGQSSSGVSGYHVLLTDDQNATPSANTGDSCYKLASAESREYIVGSSPSGCSLSNGTWYLRVQTKDNSGNTADPVTAFIYKYDGSIPYAPSSVATTTVGYTANNSFTFYWPSAVDNGPSGVAGYEYKTGTSSGTLSDWQYTTATTVTGIEAYQEGQNFFYVRTKDNAGNYSGSTSNDVQVGTFYYNQSAPSAPTNVAMTPASNAATPSDSNVFSVSWEKPSNYSGEIAKYYYCVNCTPSSTTMTETTSSQTVNKALTNLALATQQGKNTFYIVAEDNNINVSTGHGNRNFEAYASVDFYASTTAPGAPQKLTVSDVSDRDNDIWRLTLAWTAPASGGTPSKYEVYRSLDGETYSKVGETTSTAYTDADLTQSTTYYYKTVAIDNAGSSSIASNVVNSSPQGKYSSPPSAGGIPSVTAGSTTATITWLTSRSAFGSVEYGKDISYGSVSSEASASASHSIKVTGLSPGTEYHYRTQSLDDSSLVGYERGEAYTTDYSFTTLTSPSISGVSTSDLSLNSAVVSWSTNSLSTATIHYGKTTAYGSILNVNTSASESSHSARLSNLDHSTTYHFSVKGTTVDGDEIASDDYTFKTVTFPKVTATVFNTDQSSSGTTIVMAWATNIATTGEVQYQALEPDMEQIKNSKSKIKNLLTTLSGGKEGVDLKKLQALTPSELGEVPAIPKGKVLTAYSGKMETKHIEYISGLDDGSLYVFTIRGRDEYGNEAIGEPVRYLTGADTRAPVIKNVIIETPITGVGSEAKSQIIISWETDEPALGQILWGQGTGNEYPQSTEKEESYSTKHVMVMRDLEPTSSYHLKIVSIDSSNNKSESKDTVVVTPTAQQAAFDIILKNLEDVFGFLKL